MPYTLDLDLEESLYRQAFARSFFARLEIPLRLWPLSPEWGPGGDLSRFASPLFRVQLRARGSFWENLGSSTIDVGGDRIVQAALDKAAKGRTGDCDRKSAWLFARSINLFKYQGNHSWLMDETDFMAIMWTVLATSAGIAYFLRFLLSLPDPMKLEKIMGTNIAQVYIAIGDITESNNTNIRPRGVSVSGGHIYPEISLLCSGACWVGNLNVLAKYTL
ncbi:hypothetical protein M434DRAFT_36531 [Hypoxylon sp. CO27-5]|nr:hypothetical protein M434DRAFT_36531 [Hypoxylon sp. CO27-5]